MVIPIVVLVIYSFLYYFVILNFSGVLQGSIDNTAQEVAKYEYMVNRGINCLDSLKDSKNKEKIAKLNISTEFINKTMDASYVYSQVLFGSSLESKKVRKLVEKIDIVGGILGLNFFTSDFGDKNGEKDIVVNYIINIPVLGYKYKLFNTQRTYFKSWIGDSLDVMSSNKDKIVYITSTGTVYHTNKNCSHINLSLVRVKFKDILSLRNNSGGKYYKCDKCVKSKISGEQLVFIATNGTKYHLFNQCSGIKRNVKEIKISEVGKRSLCKRCESGEK